MDNTELFQIVGKLYIDLYGAQRIIQQLQANLQEKDTMLAQQRAQLSAMSLPADPVESNESTQG